MKKWAYVIATIATIIFSFVLFVRPTQAATDDSLQRIKDKGVLVMGTSADFPPYEFQTKIDGKTEIVGMDVEIGKKIAKDLGVRFEVKDMNFDSLIVGLKTKKVDMVISGLSPTDERRQNMDFSDLYYKGGQTIVVNKADAKLYKNKSSFKKLTVGAQNGSIQADLIKSQMKGTKLYAIDKIPDLVLALSSHKIAGIVMEEPSAKAYVKNNDGLAIIKANFDVSGDEVGNAAAFPKGSSSLVAAANKSISEIKKDNLLNQYLSKAATYMKGSAKERSIINYWSYFAKGVGYTLLITFFSVLIGIALGIILALMRLSKIKIFKIIAGAYVEFIRGTPLMIQIMFVYFGLGLIVNIPALLSGIIAVSINSSAYVAEIIRGGLNSVDKGQTEAARSLGLSSSDTLKSVVLPQALRNIWPSLGNEFISVIKESSIVSIIGVTDLIYQLNVVRTATYDGVAPIAVAMILYFIMTFSLSKVLNYYERKMKHD